MSVRMFKIGRGTSDVLYCTMETATHAVQSWFPLDTTITEVWVLSVAEHEEYQRLKAGVSDA